MKFTTLLTAFLLFSLIVNSQGLVFQKNLSIGYSQYIEDIILINDDTYLAFTTSSANSSGTARIQKLDPNGNEVWTVSLPYSLYNPKLIYTADNHILVYATGGISCDVGPQIIYLAKINLSGSPVWAKTYNKPTSGQAYDLILAELNNGKLLMAVPTFFPVGTEYIYEINNQGDLFDSIPYFGTHPDMFASLDNETFVTINGAQIIKFDTSGVRLDSVQFGDTPIDVTTDGNNDLFISTFNNIRRFDFNLLENTPVSLPNTTYLRGLKIQNNKLSALAKVNQNLTILNFDNSFNLFSSYSYLDPAINHEIGDFEHSKLVTSKNIIYSSRFYKNIHLAKYDTIANFTNASSLDISITDIIITDYLINFVAQPNVYNINPEVRVEITNNSQETLNSLWVNAYRRTSVDCGDHVTRAYFDSVNILPGASKKLSMGFIDNNQSQPYSSDIYENLCIYITSPNGFSDFATANNEICESHSFGTVGIQENQLMQIELHPNPASNVLNITTTQSFQIATIVNSLGSEMMTINLPGNEINISTLPNGLYFIRLSGKENLLVTSKFIKN